MTTKAGTIGDAKFASVAAMLAQQQVDVKEHLKSRPPHYFCNPQPLPHGGDQTKMVQANLTELNKSSSCLHCSNSLLYHCNNMGEQDFKLCPHHGARVSPKQCSQQVVGGFN